MTSTIKEHLIAAREATWRVREVRKYHADDEHTTLEALEIWSQDGLICEDVDTEDHARLIAVAPEMLTALKDAEELYQTGLIAASNELIDRVHKSRRAVIAKAEGYGHAG